MTVDGNTQAKLRSGLIKVLHPDQSSTSDALTRQRLLAEQRRETAVDVLLVNPPVPESRSWGNINPPIGQNWPKRIIWPQASLAQMAAMLAPDYKVAVVDAVAQCLNWAAF